MQSQNRRLILFMLFTFALMSGYTWIKIKYFTPPTLTREQLLAIEPALRLTTFAPTANGLADAVELGVRGVVDRAGHFAYAKAELAARREEMAKAKPVAPAPPKPDPIVLGGPDYHLQVTLTPRGAGVDRLVLTHFRQADRYGLPEYLDKEKKQPKSLELIPPADVPSFVLYHYAKPGDDEERPLDTLGVRNWPVTANDSGQDEHTVAFSTDLPDQSVRITKTYTLRKKEYHIGLTVKVERLPDAKDKPPFRYQLAGGHGLPIEGEWYTTIFRNTIVGWVTKDGAMDRFLEDSGTTSRNAGTDRKSRLPDMTIQYAATALQYFASAIVVDDQQPKHNFVEFVRGTVEQTVDAQKPFLDDVTVRAISEQLDLKPGQSVEHKYLLYHGPVKVRLLEQLGGEAGVSSELTHRYEHTLHLNSLTDYGRWGFWTNAIVFFTNAIHALIGILRPIVRYDGICIILVTVLVRGLMFPLSRRQQATMARTQEQMAKVAPDVKKIKEKYKNDIVQQQQAMSELYRRHGINPAAGLGGCLMLFLQMPVFLGLYFALQESFFFRLERFLWMPNLAAPDMLTWWTEKIPWISDPASQGSPLYLGPYFNILPVLAVTLMVIQQQMMTPPTADEQMQQTQKMMKWMMVIMGLMFYKMPSGLCIYFIATTLWGFLERKLSKRARAAADAAGGKPGSGDGQSSPNGKPGGPRGRGKSRDKQPEAQPSKFAEWWARVLKEASKK